MSFSTRVRFATLPSASTASTCRLSHYNTRPNHDIHAASLARMYSTSV